MDNSQDTQRRIADSIMAFATNMIINTYAVERVAFGYENPGDEAPIDLYVKQLKLPLRHPDPYKCFAGVYIDQQGRLNAEQDYDEYVRDLFVSQMEEIFAAAPKDKKREQNGDEIPFAPSVREYLFGLLPLFAEIMRLVGEYDPFDVVPIANAVHDSTCINLQKFVAAILLGPLKTGSRIDRYVRDFIAPPPYYIERLIESGGKHYYLKTADINSIDYKFAIFSAMRFLNAENNYVLQTKLREWERRNSL